MKLNQYYDPTFIHDINKICQTTIINPETKIQSAPPFESWIQNMGYQILTGDFPERDLIDIYSQTVKINPKNHPNQQLAKAFATIIQTKIMPHANQNDLMSDFIDNLANQLYQVTITN